MRWRSGLSVNTYRETGFFMSFLCNLQIGAMFVSGKSRKVQISQIDSLSE